MANNSESTSQEEQIKLPPPHRYMSKHWKSDYLQEACERSSTALNGMNRSSHELSDLIKATKVENLFLIGSKRVEYIIRLDYATTEREWEWGSRDIMLDLGAGGCPRGQRIEYLQDAAKLRGGAVHLLNLGLNEGEKSAWLKSILSVSSAAAGGDEVGPKSLLITNYGDKIDDLLKALQRSKGLHHLSLQHCGKMSDECVEVLSGLSSLTSLHLYRVYVSPQFVTTLAGLHSSRSPLPASLQRLAIEDIPPLNDSPSLSWSHLSGFLQNWSKLTELTVTEYRQHMAEEILVECIKDLPSQSPSSSLPRLYSLSLGPFYEYISFLDSSRTAVAAMVDALSRSGLPFLELVGVTTMDPAVEAQLLKNQRFFMLGGLEKVEATSMRLFICGDPYAGKTTLLSTMHSIDAGKKEKLRSFLTWGHVKPNRTQGIEVRAIKKDGIRLSLWDMAGQQEFHAFHDCMFPEVGTTSYQTPSMFMFVWSPIHAEKRRKGKLKGIKEFEDNFRYWLKFLASKSRQSNVTLKVIVVLTRADQTELLKDALKIPINSFRSQFKDVIDICDTFVVDARKNDQRVKAVLECIFKEAKEMLQGIQVYDICTKVSRDLLKHLKTSAERIIPWSTLHKVCVARNPILNDKAKLQTIALTLNDSGAIIYVNNVNYIVLDPNWFCSQIMGSLIYFPDCTSSKRTLKIQGFTSHGFLKKKLESITNLQAGMGSLLVAWMKALHLCSKVSNVEHVISTDDEEHSADDEEHSTDDEEHSADDEEHSTDDEEHSTDDEEHSTDDEENSTDDEENSTNDEEHSTNDEEHLFIPTTLSDIEEYVGLEQLQWKLASSTNDRTDYTYMGRRLECENKDLNFLTPGLFPRIQVLFNNAFQECHVNVKLGKDFIHICQPSLEIIVVFCNAKTNNVIDVLARASTKSHEGMSMTLVDAEERIINTLIKVCAQPSGIQGVRLIESAIRPDTLYDPSMAQNREDQCVEMKCLRRQLRDHLEQGTPGLCNYVWNQTKHNNVFKETSLMELLGYDNYMKIVFSYQEWLEDTSNKQLDSEVPKLTEHQHQHKALETVPKSMDSRKMLASRTGSMLLQGDQMSQEGLEIQASKDMAKVISLLCKINRKVDVANAGISRLNEKMDEMNRKVIEIHKEVVDLRSDVVSKITKRIDKLLKFSAENELLEPQHLPRCILITTDGVGRERKVLASLTRHHYESVRIELCCEPDCELGRVYPHRVERQPGITINWQSEKLQRAIPYVNVVLNVLTVAAKVGINILAPSAASLLPDWVPQLTVGKNYPSLSSITDTSLSEFSEEWQKCLPDILMGDGDPSDQNRARKITQKIAKKFLLKRTTYRSADGSDRVAWLCSKHHKEHRPASSKG